jgi:hypothetical protein
MFDAVVAATRHAEVKEVVDWDWNRITGVTSTTRALGLLRYRWGRRRSGVVDEDVVGVEQRAHHVISFIFHPVVENP